METFFKDLRNLSAKLPFREKKVAKVCLLQYSDAYFLCFIISGPERLNTDFVLECFF